MVIRNGQDRTGSGLCSVVDFAITHAEASLCDIKLAFSNNIKIVLKHAV